MKERTNNAVERAMATIKERTLDSRVCRIMEALQWINDECIKLFEEHEKDGVKRSVEYREELRKHFETSQYLLAMCAIYKYEHDIIRGGVL